MKLTEFLYSQTNGKTRARGADYFRGGAVVSLEQRDGGVDSVVQGGIDYDVRLESAGEAVSAGCTCPFFFDRLVPCKHIWATALACDARGISVLSPEAGRRGAYFSPLVSDDDARRVDDDWDDEWLAPAPTKVVPSVRAKPSRPPKREPEPWEQLLAAVNHVSHVEPPAATDPLGRQSELLYAIDAPASASSGALVLHLLTRQRKKNGEWGAMKAAFLLQSAADALPVEDREVFERLSGARPFYSGYYTGDYARVISPLTLRGALARDIVPLVCATGRARLSAAQPFDIYPRDISQDPLRWDAGGAWTFRMDVRPEPADANAHTPAYTIAGVLERDGETLALGDVVFALDGLLFTRTHAARLDDGAASSWMRELAKRGPVTVPGDLGRERLRDAILTSNPPVGELPIELQVEIQERAPRPHLSLRGARMDPKRVMATVSFDYGGTHVSASATDTIVRTADLRTVLRRDRPAEAAAIERLMALGFRILRNPDGYGEALQVGHAEVPRIVHALTHEGWHVESDGHRYRLPSEPPALDLTSGIDWFELRATIQFDDRAAPLPALLAAIHRGDGLLPLDDGTIGVIPEEWTNEYGPLALGTVDGDHLRFRMSQALLLDALLAARPSVSWDAAFAAARERLRRFDTIEPLDPPWSFTGTLRGYQREALGWLTFLRELGFGGCLADDMGLGKTIMVLALLDARRRELEDTANSRPSLVVAPRSVIYNWAQEATRFAPSLRVLDFSGIGRGHRIEQIAGHDLVLATYGTIRRDAARLADVRFDYVILDEAQTIKNAATVSAKAVRLLNAGHRLALSGTPVENRLADLWSLFEFLNPGLLSGASGFARSFSQTDTDPETLRALGRGLRPFILRRTKEQVAPELPEKTEQTIVCELEREQRALYDELRDHYRRQLLNGSSSWQRSRIHVLEALLRLRQAACHPGLVDAARATGASAKLDALVPRLVEASDEQHKTLVFSQFTTLLGLLKPRLDKEGLVYEYLDGRTRDRAARIERFQTDPGCTLFLISLKAGGLGLNLTSADYVFLLDPWWNPAAEAQAIDRTHRIGQTRHVFAYRLIARDTVEQRVIELQQRKKQLADAILTADNSIVRNLQREDLEFLLS